MLVKSRLKSDNFAIQEHLAIQSPSLLIHTLLPKLVACSILESRVMFPAFLLFLQSQFLFALSYMHIRTYKRAHTHICILYRDLLKSYDLAIYDLQPPP